jgi:hypothetical protein
MSETAMLAPMRSFFARLLDWLLALYAALPPQSQAVETPEGRFDHCDGCGDEGSLYLHSRCHIQSPTWAVLSGDVLTIKCAECEAVVVRFRIVGEEPVDG